MINELFGWLWILLGFFSGMLIGLFFAGENWLGGYGSHRRRLIRLAHVAFFGLGAINILFALGAGRINLDPAWMKTASRALILGGVTMPLCCYLMAWNRRLLLIFALPILSLLLGGILIVIGMLRP